MQDPEAKTVTLTLNDIVNLYAVFVHGQRAVANQGVTGAVTVNAAGQVDFTQFFQAIKASERQPTVTTSQNTYLDMLLKAFKAFISVLFGEAKGETAISAQQLSTKLKGNKAKLVQFGFSEGLIDELCRMLSSETGQQQLKALFENAAPDYHDLESDEVPNADEVLDYLKDNATEKRYQAFCKENRSSAPKRQSPASQQTRGWDETNRQFAKNRAQQEEKRERALQEAQERALQEAQERAQQEAQKNTGSIGNNRSTQFSQTTQQNYDDKVVASSGCCGLFSCW